MASVRPARAAQAGGDSWLKSIVKAAVGVLVLAEIALVVFLAAKPAGEVDRPTRLNIRAQGGDVRSHSNQASGVAFEYPGRWSVEDDGDVSHVAPRDEETVISIGPGPSGDALTAMEEAQSLLERSYTDVDITKRGVDTIASRLAITVLGRAVNDIGARLRFSAVTLEYGSATVMATEFDTRAGRPRMSPELKELLESLRVANASI